MSLFRYGGGKAKLAHKIITHITLPNIVRAVFVEPFVGGGSVALTVARRYPNVRIVLNDLSPNIYSFWNILACGSDKDFLALRRRVQTCHPTLALYNSLKASTPVDETDRAFRTLFFNRTSYVSSNGKRPLGGWNQTIEQEAKGIRSRWNAMRLGEELLEARGLLAGRTTVFNEDFAEVLGRADNNWVMYLDPPYYKAGNDLYDIPWKDSDHVRLYESLKKTLADWVLSYDFHPRIVEMYNHGMTRFYPVPAAYSISKRDAVEALIVPSGKIVASPQGFVPPKNFPEFYARFPHYVRHFINTKMRWSTSFSKKHGDRYTTFDAMIEDYTQDMLLFLSALPKDSKYRARGFTDPIQIFNPGLWGEVTQGKFLAYVRMLLSNKFQTVRTKDCRDALPHADTNMGTLRGETTEFNETAPEIGRFRDWIKRERPALVPIMDSMLDGVCRREGVKDDGYDSKRIRLIHLLRERFVLGKVVKRRKEYRKRTKPARPRKKCDLLAA